MTHKQFERYFGKELKPCPCCGGKATLTQWRDTANPNATWAACGNCGLMTDSCHDKSQVKAAAKVIKIWNRRGK